MMMNDAVMIKWM